MMLNKSLKVLLGILFIVMPGILCAENVEPYQKASQFAVGVDNSRLVYGKYTYNDHYFAKVNVSVYSEKIQFQYARATLGYRFKSSIFDLSGAYFIGSAFNGSYYNTGAVVKGDVLLFRRLIADATVSPWYDSGFGYKTCWEVTAGCKVTDFFNVRVGYTTMPEYRMSEKRLIGILDFHVLHLSVSPYVTVGTVAGDDGSKSIRMGFQFEYQF